MRHLQQFSVCFLSLYLAACATNQSSAPVEDHNIRNSSATVRPLVAKVFPNSEHAGEPGYYTVQPGDTLLHIALEFGQNWRDIVGWNAIDNPNVIEVGQVLRIAPPALAKGSSGVSVQPVTSSQVNGHSLSSEKEKTSSQQTAATAPTAANSSSAIAPETTRLNWIWPTQGSVTQGFDESKNKGVDISGELGQPVLAAANGKVIYAGSGLRGYGNLIIIKHDNTFLTAYAHNKTLLVKEDETVSQGQKIAEMGDSDSDRVGLHFEIRKQGKPVDPTQYLPAQALK